MKNKGVPAADYINLRQQYPICKTLNISSGNEIAYKERSVVSQRSRDIIVGDFSYVI